MQCHLFWPSLCEGYHWCNATYFDHHAVKVITRAVPLILTIILWKLLLVRCHLCRHVRVTIGVIQCHLCWQNPVVKVTIAGMSLVDVDHVIQCVAFIGEEFAFLGAVPLSSSALHNPSLSWLAVRPCVSYDCCHGNHNPESDTTELCLTQTTYYYVRRGWGDNSSPLLR